MNNPKKAASKKPAAKKQPITPAGGNDDKAQALTLHRFKVVELATQLASAQLIATAHLKASSGVAAATKRVASAFLMASARLNADREDMRCNPDLVDCAFVDRACSDLLRSANVDISVPPELLHLDHTDLDPLFRSAMCRAQKLLRSPLEDSSIIYAEQTFDPDELISENKVFERLSKWDWPALSSRPSVTTFMENVENWFCKHRAVQENGISGQLGDNAIEDNKFLERILNFCNTRRDTEVFGQILSVIEKSWDKHQVPAEAHGDLAHDWTHKMHLIIHCFDGTYPTPRIKMPQGRAKERQYRPWGIFRYLRFWGDDDEVGRELNQKLQASRSVLNPENEPSNLHIYPNHRYEFGPLGIVAEKLHQEEMDRQETEYQAALRRDRQGKGGDLSA